MSLSNLLDIHVDASLISPTPGWDDRVTPLSPATRSEILIEPPFRGEKEVESDSAVC